MFMFLFSHLSHLEYKESLNYSYPIYILLNGDYLLKARSLITGKITPTENQLHTLIINNDLILHKSAK